MTVKTKAAIAAAAFLLLVAGAIAIAYRVMATPKAVSVTVAVAQPSKPLRAPGQTITRRSTWRPTARDVPTTRKAPFTPSSQPVSLDVSLLPNDIFTEVNDPGNYTAEPDAATSRNGGPPALLLSSATASPTDKGRAVRDVDIKPFLGKRVRFSAYLKFENLTNWGGLLLTTSDDAGRDYAMDEMMGRGIIHPTDWARYEIVCDIAPQATSLNLGLHLYGSGQLWLDGARLEVVGNGVPTTDDHNAHLYTFSAANYSAASDPAVQRNGHPTLRIASTSRPAGSCSYGWIIRATEPYLRHRIRLTAWIKTERVTGAAHLAVWARVEGNLIRLDSAGPRRSVKGTTDWKKYELTADVPRDLDRFNPCVNLAGAGKVWIDELRFELMPDQ